MNGREAIDYRRLQNYPDGGMQSGCEFDPEAFVGMPRGNFEYYRFFNGGLESSRVVSQVGFSKKNGVWYVQFLDHEDDNRKETPIDNKKGTSVCQKIKIGPRNKFYYCIEFIEERENGSGKTMCVLSPK